MAPVSLRTGSRVSVPKQSSVVHATVKKVEKHHVLIQYDGKEFEDEWVLRIALEGYNAACRIGDNVVVPRNSTWAWGRVKAMQKNLVLVKFEGRKKAEWIVEASIAQGKPARIGEEVVVNKFSKKKRAKVVRISDYSALIEYTDKKLPQEWIIMEHIIVNKPRLLKVGMPVRIPKTSVILDAKILRIDGNFVKVQYLDSRFTPEWILKETALASLSDGKKLLPIIPKQMELHREPENRPTAAPIPVHNTDSHIHGHTLAEVKRVFLMFDTDAQGWITDKDLAACMQSMGLYVSEKEAQSILAKSDINKDGKVDFDEFITFIRNRPADSVDKLRSAFRKYDVDGDGTIALAELRKALTTRGEAMTDEEVDEFFAEMDQDGSGTIDFEEFMAYMISN